VGGLLQEQRGTLACKDPAFEYHLDFCLQCLEWSQYKGMHMRAVDIIFSSSWCVLQVEPSSLVCEDLADKR
jgi:hypothetical protein